jgi:hypothetical protein
MRLQSCSGWENIPDCLGKDDLVAGSSISILVVNPDHYGRIINLDRRIYPTL